MNILDTILSKKNKTQKNKKFKTLKCHPNLKNTIKSHSNKSCLDKNTILLLKNIWNKRNPDRKIKGKKRNIIWKNFKNEMKYVCNNEKCWIDKIINNNNNHNHKLKEQLFVPNAPISWNKNINEWLSSVDIKKVMKQYEEKFPNFSFIGPSPIDFNEKVYNECVWPELCNFNVQYHLQKNKNKIGIIFNTDPHYKSGSHWISLFIDFEKKTIFYFDSNGNPMPKEIRSFINTILDQCNSMNLKMKTDSNEGFRHQNFNTECGMYCLWFIISILENKHNFKYFKNKKIKDKSMEQLRNVYFNLM